MRMLYTGGAKYSQSTLTNRNISATGGSPSRGSKGTRSLIAANLQTSLSTTTNQPKASLYPVFIPSRNKPHYTHLFILPKIMCHYTDFPMHFSECNESPSHLVISRWSKTCGNPQNGEHNAPHCDIYRATPTENSFDTFLVEGMCPACEYLRINVSTNLLEISTASNT